MKTQPNSTHHQWQGQLSQTFSKSEKSPVVSKPSVKVQKIWEKRLLVFFLTLLISHWVILSSDITILNGEIGGGLGGWLFMALFPHQFMFIFGIGFMKIHRLLIWPLWYLTQMIYLLFQPSRLKQRTRECRYLRTTPLKLLYDANIGTLRWNPATALCEEVDASIDVTHLDEPEIMSPGELNLENGDATWQIFTDSERAQISMEIRSTKVRNLEIALDIDEDLAHEFGIIPDDLPVMNLPDRISLPQTQQRELLTEFQKITEAVGLPHHFNTIARG